jgi:hypothetical protein
MTFFMVKYLAYAAQPHEGDTGQWLVNRGRRLCLFDSGIF